MKRLMVVVCLVLAGFGGLGVTSQGVVHAAGNSDAAHACQQGGYQSLQGSDGTTFTNEGQCVSYAAHGGIIVGLSTCVVTGDSGCVTFTTATLPSITGNGNSITLTGATSFADTCTSGNCNFSVPNTLATGGGTYVETNSAGTVISQGSYRIAATAGYPEGLSGLQYLDGSSTPVSTCAAATGERAVLVSATLIDSSTHATDSVVIAAATGSLSGLPAAFVANVGATAEEFFGSVPSTQLSVTC